MKNTNKVIIVIVLVLVVIFGIGEFFAGPVSAPVSPSATSTDSASAPAASAPAATQIVKYMASMPASSTAVEQGSCWTNSISAPFRGDAWRCTVGNAISDPCFQIPGQQKLLCNVNPLDPSSSSTFVLALTKPLPASQPVQGEQPSDNVWLLELQGGTLCSPYTGTLPITQSGDIPTFACAPGPLGNDLNIFNINSSSSVWTAEVGTIAPAPANSTSGMPIVESTSTIPIAEVWQ